MQYMLLIYGPEQAPSEAAEQPMEEMAPWFAYSGWLREKGIYRAGEPLAPTTSATTVRVRDGRTLTTDGPFAETKEVLGGYYIIETDDFDLALEAAARCPGALYGSLEVRPIVEIPAPAGAG